MDAELMTISSIEFPSFNRSIVFKADLSRVTAEIAGKDDFLSEDFEFSFASIKLDSNTKFPPVYPIFSSSLVKAGLKSPEEEKHLGFRSSSSLISSDAKKLDNICSTVTAEYCVLKSNSTGSGALESGKLKLRDIVFGRSQSEGNKPLLEKKMEKSCFSLFRFGDKTGARGAEKKGKENRGVVKELDIVSAHRIYYGRGTAGGGQMPVVGSRRSFLPYRQELLSGLFYCSSRRNRF